jgi:hypothetical protein
MSVKSRAGDPPVPNEGPEDLPTQLESILHQVWAQEARWRVEDRIDLAVRSAREGPSR